MGLVVLVVILVVVQHVSGLFIGDYLDLLLNESGFYAGYLLSIINQIPLILPLSQQYPSNKDSKSSTHLSTLSETTDHLLPLPATAFESFAANPHRTSVAFLDLSFFRKETANVCWVMMHL